MNILQNLNSKLKASNFFIIFLHSFLKILFPVQIVVQRLAFFTSQGQGSEVINIMVDPSNKMLGPKAKVATRRI